MEGFTIIDAAAAGVIVLSAILAYSRGFVREAMAIAGWIAAAFAAFLFAAAAQPLIRELPMIGDFLGDSCELSIIAAFAAVFAVALLLVSLFTPLFSGAIRNSPLDGLDRVAGFLFGAVRGVLLVAVAMLVYDRVAAVEAVPMVEQSRTAAIFSRSEDELDEMVPEDATGWIVARYEELVSVCDIPQE